MARMQAKEAERVHGTNALRHQIPNVARYMPRKTKQNYRNRGGLNGLPLGQILFDLSPKTNHTLQRPALLLALLPQRMQFRDFSNL